jgi:hypothetical protein
MNKNIKNKIIENGVKNLEEFGYKSVTTENILTDEVYKMFFKSMLMDNLGQGFDEEINSILEDLNS